MGKRFKTEDVLSVYTGRLLGGMEGIYEVMSHLTRQDVYTHQIPSLFAPCKRAIEEQLPALAAPEVAEGLFGLADVVKSATDESEIRSFIDGYLAGVKARLGETLPLAPMDDAEFYQTDPVESLQEMMGDRDKVIIISEAE